MTDVESLCDRGVCECCVPSTIFQTCHREGLEEVKETGKVGPSSRIALSLHDRQGLRIGGGCQNWSSRTGTSWRDH